MTITAERLNKLMTETNGLNSLRGDELIELYTLALAGIAGNKDAERLDAIEEEFLDVTCHSTQIADTGDYTTWWEVKEWHVGKSEPVVLGLSTSLRKALDAAIAQGEGVKS